MEPKQVSWECVRNIANALTNQLYLADVVDIRQAHISSWSGGARRHIDLEDGREGSWRQAEGLNGWIALDECDVRRIVWESASSGNMLEVRKVVSGQWELRYVPSFSDPEYRGGYWDIYSAPETVQNIDPKYVYDNH